MTTANIFKCSDVSVYMQDKDAQVVMWGENNKNIFLLDIYDVYAYTCICFHILWIVKFAIKFCV